MNGNRFYSIRLDRIRRTGKRRVRGRTRYRCNTHRRGAGAVIISILVFLLLVDLLLASQCGLPPLYDGRRGPLDRSNVDVVVNEASHARVTCGSAASSENDGDKMMVGAAHRGDDVETGRAHLRGLEVLHATPRG